MVYSQAVNWNQDNSSADLPLAYRRIDGRGLEPKVELDSLNYVTCDVLMTHLPKLSFISQHRLHKAAFGSSGCVRRAYMCIGIHHS